MNQKALDPFPKLKTNKLVLDQLLKEDVGHLLEITSFNYRAKTEEELDQLLLKINEQFEAKTGITWALYLKGEILGTVGFYRGFDNDEGEVGYVIREKYRKQGYLTEALTEVIRFGFEEMKLDAISAYTPDYNHASVQALEKFQFKKTEEHSGIHRKWLLSS